MVSSPLCRLIETLFMTSVKLEAPMSGPAADQHRQQLALDARDLMAERNLAELKAMGLGYVFSILKH